MAKRNKPYTKGYQDIEMTFERLEKEEKRARQIEWLRKREEERKPKIENKNPNTRGEVKQ